MFRWSVVILVAVFSHAYASGDSEDGHNLTFGTSMGMAKEQLERSIVLERYSDNGDSVIYRSKQAPVNKYMADQYFYTIGDDGLCRTVAKISDVDSPPNMLASDLMSNYGKPIRYDGDDGSVPDGTVHYPSKQYRIPSGVDDILLHISDSRSAVMVILFENFPDC